LALSLVAGGPAVAGEAGAPLVDPAAAHGGPALVSGRDGAHAFAGRDLTLSDMSGVVGHASQLAYVAVLRGRAQAGDLVAKPGWMLLLPPHGGAPQLERFDAARLARTWDADPAAAPPEARAAAAALAKSQRAGLFWGRLRRTNLNVAASGAPGRERERRALVDAPAVRALRFDAAVKPGHEAAALVRAAADALRARDAATLAQFLDPAPFGAAAATPGNGPRRAQARALIERHDWPALIADVDPTPGLDDRTWLFDAAGGLVVMRLRAADGFIFIERLTVEARP
jgi:hypothetical protein